MKKNSEFLGGKIARELARYDAVVITGASSGIGLGFAKAILGCGVPLKLCNLSRSFPAELKDSENFLHVPCDLQKDENISEALSKVFEFIGAGAPKPPRVLLINNSGFGAYGEFPAPSVSRLCGMVDLNARAVVRLCGEFSEIIKKGKGSIVNIASTAAFQPCPHLAVYAATKSFVKSFTLGISYEFRRAGCKCLCVCPGPTSSNFFKAAGFDSPPLPSGFGHKPRDVVLAALRALAGGDILKVVGFSNSILAFLARFAPTRLIVYGAGEILRRIRKL